MATVLVNDIPVDIGDEKLNCIQAAERAGVTIPHYCWHPALSVVASCRMCLVMVGEKKPDGTVAMQPKVVPGCQTPVKDGTVIQTLDPKSTGAQQSTLESLLLNHPLDCPVCDKAGECLLQDYSFQFGKATSRMVDEKNTPPNKPNIGPNISLFTDRCIMCSRCVRFTREVAGTAELHVVQRGNHSEIDVFPGHPIDNKLASNVVDLCPVGALASNDFLYKQRVWNLKTVKSVCTGCSTGCSIHLDTNKSVVYRLRPRFNPRAQGHFMCDEGRLGYHNVNSALRFNKPLERTNAGTQAIDWQQAVTKVDQSVRSAAQTDAGKVWFVLSPFLTTEEAWLLASYARSVSPFCRIVAGPVPHHGVDDTYPKDRKGNPSTAPVKFTIRAEKCPNRRGVEAVVSHFQKNQASFADLLAACDRGEVAVAFVTSGYSGAFPVWGTENAEQLGKAGFLIVHDMLPSAVSDAATIVIPAASFSEKDGTYINHAGLAQTTEAGCVPQRGARTDGQIYLDLLGRRGLVRAIEIRKEIGKAVPALAALASGELGEHGIFVTAGA
jgi:NADH-quinone oxidoreductase subunit G